MKDVSKLSWIAAFLGFACVLSLGDVRANQTDQITSDFDHVKIAPKEKDPKHTPKIECPDQVTAGEWFEVTVTCGVEALHPTMNTHYVNWIAIFKDDVEIARAYLNPVHTMPKVTFTIALERSCVLRVQEAPNHTAAWENSKKIKVVPAQSEDPAAGSK